MLFSQVDELRTRRILRVLAIVYAVLIVYGSLLPWSGWHRPLEGLFGFLRHPILVDIARKRLAENVLIYAPLGFLLAASDKRVRNAAGVLLVTAAGAALSFSMETLQQCVAARHASSADALANTIGTLAGATVALALGSHTPIGRFLARQREQFRPGLLIDSGLLAIVLWVLSQWTPLVPVLGRAGLHENFAPIMQAFHSRHPVKLYPFAEQAFCLAGLLLLVARLRKDDRGAAWFAVFASIVVLATPFFHRREITAEAIAALIAVLVLSPLLLRLPLKGRLGAAMLMASFLLRQLEPRPGVRRPFTLIPFREYATLPLDSVPILLGMLWPFMAVGCIVATSTDPRLRRQIAIAGGLLVFLAVFALEWSQQEMGWHGDLTHVLLALAGWCVPWVLPQDTADSA